MNLLGFMITSRAPSSTWTHIVSRQWAKLGSLFELFGHTRKGLMWMWKGWPSNARISQRSAWPTVMIRSLR